MCESKLCEYEIDDEYKFQRVSIFYEKLPMIE